MALALGTVFHGPLAAAFQLLDWAQSECDGAAVGKFLPDAAPVTPTAKPVANTEVKADTPDGIMSDARCHLEASIGVMRSRLDDIKGGAYTAATSLMKVALVAIIKAIDGQTTELQEDASCCLFEADAVLNFVAETADDQSTWGALTLLMLCKEKFDSTIGAFDEVAQ